MAQAEKAVVQLAPNMLHELDYINASWDVIAGDGVTPEDVERVEFWALHANRMRAWDEIRVRASDGSWVAWYLVLDRDITWAKVHRIRFIDLAPKAEALPEEVQSLSDAKESAIREAHEIKFRGRAVWSVVRKSDGAVIAEKMASKDAAQSWLDAWIERQIGGGAAPPTGLDV